MIKRILSLTICVIFIFVAMPTTVFAAECEHDYGDWCIIVEVDCENDGMEIRNCILCGNTQTTILEKAYGHSYGEWETKREVSCTEDGIEARVCSNCEGEELRYTDKYGHNFEDSEWVTQKEASCTEDGIEARVCSNCGGVETRSIDAYGHIFEDGECTGCGIILGDVNIDYSVDLLDLILIKDKLLGLELIYEFSMDVNIDGEVSALDFLALKKILFESF